jgi:uncharacterized protein YjdB
MIRKRLLSACLALALCLGLLPVTALAAENAPTTLYVGDQSLPVGQNSCWTTDANTGKLTEYTTGGDEWTVKYDPSTATLTLKNATIIGVPDNVNTVGAGIYAASSSGSVSLNIVLVGENKVTGVYGINVSSEGAASLSITDSGSLTVSATAANGIGIFVQAQSDANLTIDGANVNAVVTETNGRGVELRTGQAGKPNLTIEFKGGSLQASGQPNGIKFFTNANNTCADANLKVSGNAMVKTSGITTDADGSGSQGAVLTTEAGSGETGGIVFDGNDGTVYGKVELQEDLEIGEGESLKLDNDASLNAGGHNVIVDGGTLDGGFNLGDSVIYKVTKVELDKTSLTLDVNQSETLTATITPSNATDKSLTWESSDTNIATVDTNGVVTAVAQGSTTITATAADGSGEKATCSVTVKEAANVPVTSVSLDKTTLELTEGETAQLTATVLPDNATNKAVTWSTSNASIATVDANGLVTAVSAGTATITVTTEDGSKTATCEVTVTAQTYNISVTPATLNFGSLNAGYAAAPAAQTVTITNTGNQSVTVNLPTSTNYTITAGAGFTSGTATLTQNGTAQFTVQPKTGLAAGNYNETLAISGSNNTNASITVSFTVEQRSSDGGPTTYAVTAPDVENGTVRVSPSRASRGTTVTITVTPDEGYELESLTVLDSRDNEITLTDKGDGKYTFTMPAGRVTVEASFAEIAPEPLPFGDMDDGDWFADAVRFVYENGMMNGVSETDFAPHAATSRSMIVTILYRLEGEPVVDYAMDFTDVAGDAYYAEAVRWAASEGIVGGYGGGLFGSDDAVTREQLAVILYRYAVYKGYDVSIGEDTNILSYADFADLSEYAIPAMQWACGAGIVNGTSESTLTPQGEATRAQVAAMLMRFVEAIG